MYQALIPMKCLRLTKKINPWLLFFDNAISPFFNCQTGFEKDAPTTVQANNFRR